MSATDTARHLLKLLGLKDCIGQAGPYSAKNTCGTVGSAFLSIMQNVYRPFHPNNIAMLYVVGPKGKGHRGPRNRVNEPQFDDPGEFLAMVKTTARTAMNVVAHHNNNIAETDPEDIIRDISWNTFSGGTYRHENVTKLEVAQEIIRGIQSENGGRRTGSKCRSTKMCSRPHTTSFTKKKEQRQQHTHTTQTTIQRKKANRTMMKNYYTLKGL